MNKLLIGGATLALAFPALAQVAQAPAPAPVPQLQRGPHGAKVETRADVQSHVARMFARLDTNRDGFITRPEADAAAQALHAKAGRAEKRFGERSERSFERLDTNRDGAISRAEWDAAQAQRQQRFAQRDRDGDGRPDGGRLHRGGFAGLGGRMFEMADANRDGRVSLQEAQAAALQHFDMIDANHDGRITPEERMQAHQRMRDQHRG